MNKGKKTRFERFYSRHKVLIDAFFVGVGFISFIGEIKVKNKNG